MTLSFPRANIAALTLALLSLAPDGAAQQELLKLIAADGSAGDQFGWSVAIDGGHILIGASQDDEAEVDSGSAYVLERTTGQEIWKLVPADGDANDRFGDAVALSGTLAVVGAPNDDDRGVDSGSAYVFEVSAGTQLHKLTASNGVAGDLFGLTVAVDGNHAIIGAPNAAGLTGSAYIFDVTTGQELLQLTASDASLGDNFGLSVGISGDRAIIGVPLDDDFGPNSGSAFLFDTTNGQELFKLTASDAAGGADFGYDVAISGERAIVGAWRTSAGSAYLFDVALGQELFALAASDAEDGERYGWSVALDGQHAAIGAHRDDDLGARSGSTYIVDLQTGAELFKLTASDGEAFEEFGWDVAIDGDRAVMGARRDGDLGADSGSSYVFSIPLDLGTGYCFGDGSGMPCPCANASGPGVGCSNSTGVGALLTASGSSSATADDLTLEAALPPGHPGLLFAGINAEGGGGGLPFGDGLRCVSGFVTRLGVVTPDGNVAATWGPGLGPIGGWTTGDTRFFQVWYRDIQGPCGAGFNFTNGVGILFGP